MLLCERERERERESDIRLTGVAHFSWAVVLKLAALGGPLSRKLERSSWPASIHDLADTYSQSSHGTRYAAQAPDALPRC